MADKKQEAANKQQEAKKTPAPVFNIDGVQYTADNLSDNAKALIRNLRAADREIAQQEVHLHLFRIARQTIARSLKAELDAGKVTEKK